MLTLFWNVKGPINIHFFEKRTTVNGTSYCQLLMENSLDFENESCVNDYTVFHFSKHVKCLSKTSRFKTKKTFAQLFLSFMGLSTIFRSFKKTMIKGSRISTTIYTKINAYKSIGFINIHGTHVTSNNSTNNNVVFFLVSDLKILYYNNY